MALKQNYPAVCCNGPLGLCGHFRPGRYGGKTYIRIHCALTGQKLAGTEAYDGCVNHKRPAPVKEPTPEEEEKSNRPFSLSSPSGYR